MIKYIIFSIISFTLGLFTKEILDAIDRTKKYKKVKKLNEQDFEKAMKDLEIK